MNTTATFKEPQVVSEAKDNFRKDDDVRWQFGVLPKAANFAWVQHVIHHLAPQGMAGFVLANPTRIAHCCPMKIVEDVCKYAAEQGVAEAEALAKGMAEKSKEFVQGGAELYQPEQAVVEQLQGIQHDDLQINHRQIY